MSSTGPLISVIIPVRDGERFLGEAIASVVAQDYRPVELIVVDDGSTDGTAAVARSSPDVVYIRQDRRGVAAARNAGLRRARGEMLAFLDSDDRWAPGKLSAQAGYLRDHPDVRFVMTRAEYFLEPGCPVPPGFRRELLEGDHVAWLLGAFLGWRSVFDTCGEFRADLPTAEDVEWFTRVKDAGMPFAVLPDVLLRVRIHDANTSLNTGGSQAHLLSALKHSIARKRDQRQDPSG